MADAFVAVADDATAASWNPAGLVQLERSEIAIVGAYNNVFESLSADFHPEIDRTSSASNVDLNFLSVTYPLPPRLTFGRNVSVGLYYQQKYDFSREFVLNQKSSRSNSGIVQTDYQKLDFEQKGSISTISPAIAFEITNRLSLGVALNLYRSNFLAENAWEQELNRRTLTLSGPTLALAQTTIREEYKDFNGENLTLGLLWSITDRWSVGARWDTAFTGRANFQSTTTTTRRSFSGGTPLGRSQSRVSEPRDIRFPNTYAAGAAVRVNDRLTLSADVTRTDWNDFWFRGRDGNRTSLINASNLDTVAFSQTFKDTYTVRLGGEYVLIPRNPQPELSRLWSFRAGVFYDQEPASRDPDDFWGITFGVGLLANQRINIDAAVQVRYGKDVNADFIRGIEGFEEDVVQGRFVLSTVVYF